MPFALVGLDTDNGGEFINHALINWAVDRNIYFNIRIYDTSRTPYQRVLESEVMDEASQRQLEEIFDATNPAELTKKITHIQQELIRLAADKNNVLVTDRSRAKIAEARTKISRAS